VIKPCSSRHLGAHPDQGKPGIFYSISRNAAIVRSAEARRSDSVLAGGLAKNRENEDATKDQRIITIFLEML
jgi:hypothetical protein